MGIVDVRVVDSGFDVIGSGMGEVGDVGEVGKVGEVGEVGGGGLEPGVIVTATVTATATITEIASSKSATMYRELFVLFSLEACLSFKS